MGKKWRYGVIFDAGSSGTRLHIYRWKDAEKARQKADEEDLHSLPQISTEKKWTKKVHPGIATFGEKATEVGREYLQPLIDHALDHIPEDKIEDTPIFLMATAGMRLLPQIQQSALTHEICSYFRRHTKFWLPDCDTHIQVIKGETEGLYGWIAANYLLGGFDHPEKHAHGKGHHTYGFLDMGGASAQIAFAPNATEAERHAEDLKLLRLRTLDGLPSEYKVFTTTWLGFGVNRAREAYVNSLKEQYADSKSDELPDPCMPKTLRTTLEGTPVRKPKSGEVTLVGTGKFDECLRQTYPLLGKEKPCPDSPCLINGQHSPAIDFDINHFVGVSEYWHTTHGVFGGDEDDSYDFALYQKRVKQFCSQDWDSIDSKIDHKKKHDAKNAQEACFKASWLINILHEGIGIPRIGLDFSSGINSSTKGSLAASSKKTKGFADAFQPVDKIEGVEVSWTLGKMILYASGQIPPKSGDDKYPVGFGSNIVSGGVSTPLPPDFQFAGSDWRNTGHHGNQTLGSIHDDDDDWGDHVLDKAKDRTTSGVLFFLLVFFGLVYLFRKRDRRLRLYAKVNTFFHGGKRPGGRFGGPPRKGGASIRGLSGLITSKLFRNGSSSRSGVAYERVLEEGELNQFELGDVDSLSSFEEGNEYSDSSLDGGSSSSSSRSFGGGSRFSGGSGSGSTPKMFASNGFETMPTTGAAAALDRSGLVVRTESRDRLALPGNNLQMLNAGRRSRAGSPTRLKSPAMGPLSED